MVACLYVRSSKRLFPGADPANGSVGGKNLKFHIHPCDSPPKQKSTCILVARPQKCPIPHAPLWLVKKRQIPHYILADRQKTFNSTYILAARQKTSNSTYILAARQKTSNFTHALAACQKRSSSGGTKLILHGLSGNFFTDPLWTMTREDRANGLGKMSS